MRISPVLPVEITNVTFRHRTTETFSSSQTKTHQRAPRVLFRFCHPANMRLAGPLRAVAAVLVVGLTWLLASSLLGGDGSSVMKSFFSGGEEETTPEPRPRKYKCGLSAPCPPKHLAFRLVSGAANVIGPKICLEDKILISSVKNNVGRGLNIALVNDVSDLLKFLRPLHEGTLVFVASFDDAATKLNDEARRLFEELGSTAVKELAFRDSWVFVGARGIDSKSPFEQRMKNSKTSNKYEGWPESLEMDGCIPLRSPLES
ncbi:protein FAM3A isoform X2 [Astyanax mexicanus]|uniref:Protein FAM3A isoform X2 n=1 Tax=Astyanax mexicanus TaxID=7994 RepID=A0A8T2LBT9_ASTMX|nr:protein FAM3A isoform X2 [Astyanax mexicanus]